MTCDLYDPFRVVLESAPFKPLRSTWGTGLAIDRSSFGSVAAGSLDAPHRSSNRSCTLPGARF
jgi:hypothetical protein